MNDPIAAAKELLAHSKDPEAVIIRALELHKELSEAGMTPRIDGAIRIISALFSAGYKLIRPAVSVGALVFAGYCQVHGVALPEWLTIGLSSLFPTWFAARQWDKARKPQA